MHKRGFPASRGPFSFVFAELTNTKEKGPLLAGKKGDYVEL